MVAEIGGGVPVVARLEGGLVTPQRITVSTLLIGLLLLLGAAAKEAGKEGGKGQNEQNEKKRRSARLELPIAGAVAAPAGGTFAGTLHIQRFAASDGKVVAIGIVTGSVASPPGNAVGTALAGEVALPVTMGPTAVATAALVTQQQTCDVLHLEIGPVALDVLGLKITTLPISIDLSAESGGTNVLGTLICLILETLGNVLGLVDLLNQLLGVLGGLTG